MLEWNSRAQRVYLFGDRPVKSIKVKIVQNEGKLHLANLRGSCLHDAQDRIVRWSEILYCPVKVDMFPHLWAIKQDEMECTVSAPRGHSAVFTFPIAIISSILAALQMYYGWKSLIDDCGQFNPASVLNNGINFVKIKTIELKHKSVLHAPKNFDMFAPSKLFYFQPAETTCGVGGFLTGA